MAHASGASLKPQSGSCCLWAILPLSVLNAPRCDSHAVILRLHSQFGEDALALDEIPLQGIGSGLFWSLHAGLERLAGVYFEVLRERDGLTGRNDMALVVEPAIDELDGVLVARLPGEAAGVLQGQVDRDTAASDHLYRCVIAVEREAIGYRSQGSELNAIGGELHAILACGVGQHDAGGVGAAEVIGAQADPLRAGVDAAKGILESAHMLLIDLDSVLYDGIGMGRVAAIDGVGGPAAAGVIIVHKDTDLVVAIREQRGLPGR